MLARLKQKIFLMGFFSIFLLVSMLTVIVFNIIALDAKYHQEVLQLNKNKALLIVARDQKSSKQIPPFKKSDHSSAVWSLVNRDAGMNVYITYLNKQIAAMNSLTMAQKLLSDKVNDNISAVEIVAKVISEQLDVLRLHAINNPKLLASYDDRYLKESVFLLQNISTSSVSASERKVILERSYQSLIGQAQSIMDKMLFVLTQDKQSGYHFLYGLMIFFLLILLLQIKIIVSLKRSANDIIEKVSFISDYLRKYNGTSDQIYSDGTPLEYLLKDAKISVGVLYDKNLSIENLHKKIKNSNSLASFLGYEINAMTSIVSGGLSLNQKDDAPESSFDQEIYGALTSLENLSDNFNRVFAVKDQKIDFDQEFNIRIQLHKMFVLLNATCRGLNKKFDFVIEDSVPKFAFGDAYRFYWCIYNVFVRCIEVEKRQYCLLHISESDGTSFENKTLQINLLSTSGEYLSLSSFLESTKSVDDDELFNINMKLYDRIIKSFFEGSVRFNETESGDSNVMLKLIIIPKKYEEKEQQESAKVLIYAKDGLQTSIILKKLEQAGADVVYCKSDDELLKMVSTDETFDFVFVSDDFLENKMLISILQKKIKAKMMVLSDLNDKVVADDSIGEIINLPLYLSKLLVVLANKEETEDDEEEVKKVLIVDDDPSQQFILSHFLKRVGIVPTLANDCDTALALIKDNSFDLVFMDCIMPEKDGFETTVLIREYEETLKLNGELEKELTIIGNTSLTAPSEIDKCIQSGMDTVLNKPYKKEKLLELLERYK